MKALIVDDDIVSRQVLHKLLTKYACFSEVAMNGDEAIHGFHQAHQGGDPYKAIFLDINMPNLSGLDVLRQIRQYEDEQRIYEPVAVVMVTAHHDKQTVLASFKGGCQYYLTKPLDFEKFQDIMTKLGISRAAQG